MSATVELSIVTTLYRSAATIEEFVRRSIAAAEAITGLFEIVIVDDGSPDDSLAIAMRLGESEPRIKVIELSRNFGHHKAMMTGLMHAKGAYCLLIDSDLEEKPELLGQFWGELKATDADVVYGYQNVRQGDLFRRLSGAIAWKLIEICFPQKVPRNHVTLRLMKRNYVDSLVLHKEQETVIGGLWVITGYRQIGLTIEKPTRKETTYNFRRRWYGLIDSIASFSNVPLIMIFYLGLVIASIALLFATYLLFRWFLVGVGVPGWLSVMVSVWFLGGVAIFCIGVIGIYLAKVFIETKNRPYTIVRAIYQADQPRRAKQASPARLQAPLSIDIEAK